MANNAIWQVLHYACIISHIGLAAAGFLSFATSAFNFEDQPDIQYLVRGPLATFVLGGVGFAGNQALFAFCLRVQHPQESETKAAHHFKQQIALTGSLISQVVMTVGEFGVSDHARRRYKSFPVTNLAVLGALALVVGLISISTGIADIIQLVQIRRRNKGPGYDEIEIMDETTGDEPYRDEEQV